MGFQPVVTLTAVPRDNSSYTLTDATPTGGTNGWGSGGNAPANSAAITSLFGAVQPYGGSPIPTSAITGTVATTMQFGIQVQDGVNNYYAYYGLLLTPSVAYTVSADGLTITCADPNLAVELVGITAISLDGVTYPSIIASVSGSTITLLSPVAAGTTGANFYIYWQAYVQALTINNGEALIVNGISLIPVEADHCENAMAILDNILLKIGAEIAFNCGFISKAHQAALLLSGNKPLVNNTCSTCG
jgi:hypothetical protein